MKSGSTKKKIFIPVGICLGVAAIAVCCVLLFKVFSGGAAASDYDVSMSQREVVIEKGGQTQLQVVPNKEKYKKLDVDVKWVSDDISVATVSDAGLVSGVNSGETRVKAVVSYAGREYTANCVVTVKAPTEQLSSYKLRWYTQKKDRTGYDMQEETFEREIGSKVELSLKDASKNLPANYQLNQGISRLSGTVGENPAACVLEVYYDVAKVTYTVNCYYESSKKLGTYALGDKLKLTEYAFSPVAVSQEVKEGFVLNKSVKGTRLSAESVTGATTLSAYYDRVRSKVTISYLDNRPDEVFECGYGVGIKGISASGLWKPLKGATAFRPAAYLNGKKVNLTDDLLRSISGNAKLELSVDADGFSYSKNNGALIAASKAPGEICTSYLDGSGSTIYLAATYVTTGSSDNAFGVALKCGNSAYQIFFRDRGISVGEYTEPGINGSTVVFAQNKQGSFGNLTMQENSEIKNMLSNSLGGNYRIVWAVWKGVLYGSIDGVTVVALPLTELDRDWTANKSYEIGFAACDAVDYGDALQIKDITAQFGAKAESKLITNQTIKTSEIHRVVYEPLTGAYIPASAQGPSYLYGPQTSGNTGISSTLKWVDPNNTGSRVGVSLKYGDKSHEFVISGDRGLVFHSVDHTWGDQGSISQIALRNGGTFDKKGECKITAAVKDGYFYVLFNGVEAVSVKMNALFPDYKSDKAAALGIYTYNSVVGQSHFENVKLLSAKEVGDLKLTAYPFWTEFSTANELSLETGEIKKTTVGNTSNQRVELYGSSKAWDVSGEFFRSDELRDKELMLALQVSQGSGKDEKYAAFQGLGYGFRTITDMAHWPSTNPNAASITTYAVNDKGVQFFGGPWSIVRTRNELPFRAVINNDVLYVWLDGELCWCIPLTDPQFGGFKAGGEYKFSLTIGSDNGGKIENYGGFKVDTVRMGDEVTGDTELVNKTKKIDANVARWKILDGKRLSGELADGIGMPYRYKYKATPYVLSSQSGKDIYLKTKVHMNTTNAQGDPAAGLGDYGIIISSGNQSRELEFVTEGLAIRSNKKIDGPFNDVPCLVNGSATTFAWAYNPEYNYGYGNYMWTQNILGKGGTKKSILVADMLTLAENKTAEIEFAISNGVLYGRINGVSYLAMPLSALCENWSENTNYQVGIVAKDTLTSFSCSDIELLFGDTAKAKLSADKKVAFVENNTFIYDAFTGTYIPAVSNDPTTLKTAYFTGAAGTQALQATVKLFDKSNSISTNVISVKLNGKTVNMPLPASAFDNSGTAKVTALIKDNKLYLFSNDKHVGSMELSKMFPGEELGGAVTLGLGAWYTASGAAAFSDIKLLTAADAGKIEVGDNWTAAKYIIGDMGGMMSVDTITGGLENIPGENSYVNFPGSAKRWEISGKIDRKDPADTLRSEVFLGFSISSGNKILRVMGYYNGFATYSSEDDGKTWVMNNDYRHGENELSFAHLGKVFFGTTNLPRFEGFNALYYRAVIESDTLYVWLGETKEGLKPVWRIPLDSPLRYYDNNKKTYSGPMFSGFDSGSDYSLGISMQADGGKNCDVSATLSDVTVKSGNDASTDGLNDFPTFYVQPNGIMNAEVDQAKGTYKNIKGQKESYVNFLGYNKNWDISGRIDRNDPEDNAKTEALIGFNIYSGKKILRVMGYFNGFSTYRSEDGGASWEANNDYRHGQNALSFNMLDKRFFGTSGQPRQINAIYYRAVIDNDTLYVWFGKTEDSLRQARSDQDSLTPVWRIPLNSPLVGYDNDTKAYKDNVLFSGFATGTEYGLGLCAAQSGGTACSVALTVSEITVKSGEEAKTTDISSFPRIDVRSDGIVNAEVNNEKGTYSNIPNQRESYFKFNGLSKYWEISGRIDRNDPVENEALIGFNIFSGQKILRVMGYYRGFATYSSENGGANWTANNDYRHGENDLSFAYLEKNFFGTPGIHRADGFNTLYYRAVIQNDILSVWFGEDQNNLKAVWKIPLSKQLMGYDNNTKAYKDNVLFSGFAAGTEYGFGLCASKSDGSACTVKLTVSDITVRTSVVNPAAPEPEEEAGASYKAPTAGSAPYSAKPAKTEANSFKEIVAALVKKVMHFFKALNPARVAALPYNTGREW